MQRLILLFLVFTLNIPFAIAQDDSTKIALRDSTSTLPNLSDSLHNMYGDLLNDDPAYNKKYPVIVPALRVASSVVANWASSRYIYNFEWARIGPETWKRNLKEGFEFDTDKFGTNFIGHPHTGSIYFDVARANGYNFWQSVPFAVGGSLFWEYFGENTRPSTNDIINTPISGAFLGEIFHRLSSNVLDDRTRGGERFLRELFAGMLNPTRALNRLTQGKMFRRTTVEVYQKEPLNVKFTAGVTTINNINNAAGSGATNAVATLQLDYGNPFETRKRKPFDLFRFRTEISYGKNTKYLGNVNGYGILTGRNIKQNRLLFGLFQHFDYWNNSLFQIGTIGFGGGLISRIPVAKKSNLYSTLHLAVVPFGGNSTRFGADTSDFRQYNFGGGLELKTEQTLNLNKWASVGFTGFYYFIHTYSGIPGNSLVGIFKPNVTFQLFKNVSIGVEQFIYQNDRFLNGVSKSDLHVTRTERKLFLQIFFEDPKRRGMYH